MGGVPKWIENAGTEEEKAIVDWWEPKRGQFL